MEEKWNSRTEALIGRQGSEKLEKANVIIYGIGGVGSFATEALARAGVGHLILVDNDIISESNINRQIHATTKTIGKPKVDIMKERIKEINPQAIVDTYEKIENEEELIEKNNITYVIDAIDTIKNKIKIIKKAKEQNKKIISAMGAGNKLDPTRFEVSDINKTSDCPIAKIIRKELKKCNIKDLKVVYSKEKLENTKEEQTKAENKIIGSISFVPSAMGLIIAGEVIKDIISDKL